MRSTLCHRNLDFLVFTATLLGHTLYLVVF